MGCASLPVAGAHPLTCCRSRSGSRVRRGGRARLGGRGPGPTPAASPSRATRPPHTCASTEASKRASEQSLKCGPERWAFRAEGDGGR